MSKDTLRPHWKHLVMTKAKSTKMETVPPAVSREKKVTSFIWRMGKKIGMKISGKR